MAKKTRNSPPEMRVAAWNGGGGKVKGLKAEIELLLFGSKLDILAIVEAGMCLEEESECEIKGYTLVA